MAKTGYESPKMCFIQMGEDVVTASATELSWNSEWGEIFDDMRDNTWMGSAK